MNQYISWFIVGTFIATIAFMASNHIAYGQGTENLAAQPVSNDSVKIVSPTDGQQVPVDEELIASGESSDDTSKNWYCLSYSEQHKAVSKCISNGGLRAW